MRGGGSRRSAGHSGPGGGGTPVERTHARPRARPAHRRPNARPTLARRRPSPRHGAQSVGAAHGVYSQGARRRSRPNSASSSRSRRPKTRVPTQGAASRAVGAEPRTARAALRRPPGAGRRRCGRCLASQRAAGPRPSRADGGAALAAPRTANTTISGGAPMAHWLGRTDQRAQAPPWPRALPLPRARGHGALGRPRGDRQRPVGLGTNRPPQGRPAGGQPPATRDRHPRPLCWLISAPESKI